MNNKESSKTQPRFVQVVFVYKLYVKKLIQNQYAVKKIRLRAIFSKLPSVIFLSTRRKKITQQQVVENRQAVFNYITLFINIVVQGRSLVKAFISFVYLLSVMIEDSRRNSMIVHISVAFSRHRWTWYSRYHTSYASFPNSASLIRAFFFLELNRISF